MEFLERVECGHHAEVWRVRIDDAIATAHVFYREDHESNAQIASGTRRWLAFRHPRVVPILSVSDVVPRFVITSGDERGPSITRAAKQLADAQVDREAWAVGEILALAEALAAMAAFEPSFVHRRASTEQIVVGVDGRARFRAPIQYVTVGAIPNYLGRGPGHITGFAWMSPEQVRGLPLTPAADVYQLATTLYTLLTGQRLARGDSDFALLQSIIERTQPPSLATSTPGLGDVVARGVAMKPGDRYPDPAAFARALRSLPIGEPPAAAFDVAGRQPHPAPARSVPITSGRCHMQWAQLTATTTEGIRHCETCRHDVVRVSSVLALVPLIGKRCVQFSDEN